MGLLHFVRLNAAFLAAGFLFMAGSSFGQTFFISLFAGEIRAEFGLTHAAWGQIYALGTLASAAVMVWAGGLTDRFRVRTLGAVVLGGLALACLWMAWTPGVWALVIAIFTLRLAGQGMMSHLAVVAMARWFVAARGRALSIAGLGFSAAEATLPLLIVSLLAIYDWRLIWVGAAIAALLLLPVMIGLLRLERTPQSVAAETQSDGMSGRSWTRAEVLRHPLFWWLVPALLGPSAFNTAFFFHQVHIAEVKGWAHLDFVTLIPVYTATGVAAMFLSGFAIDRIGTARLMPLYQLPMVAAFLVFSIAATPGQMLIGFLFLAVTTGANATIPNAFWAEFYGTRHIGSIKAMAAGIMVLGSAIGPAIPGTLITAGLGIESQFIGVASFFAVACACVLIGIRAARATLPRAA